ncbi:uncharacterized protein LOC127840602 [Dreissena polymorpha]|uniref:Macro domain-containing protein n=1 Tax=Dreissena polymorpha TaxID=45954 RepID=A0A9D4IWN7_DREPO|nr:uncharacterized protein LOC127840602 [Dreissena polymorpha]KAH3786963.1 hypothetical protein DPMN_165081 [Dreissena polymorpha]
MAGMTNSESETSDDEYVKLSYDDRSTLAEVDVGVPWSVPLAEVDVSIPWSVLTNFGIAAHLKSNGITVVKENTHTDTATFECKPENRHLIKSVFDQFINTSLRSQKVRFRSDLAETLLINNGRINGQVFDYICNVYRNQNVRVYRCTLSGHFYVCGKSQSDVNEATQVISQSIVEIVLTKTELKQVETHISRWSGNCKLFKHFSSEFATKFVATRDVMEDLDGNAKLDQIIKNPYIEAALMSDCGQIKEKVMELATTLCVTVLPYKEHTGMLKIVGTKQHVTQFTSEARTVFAQKDYKCTAPASNIYLIDDEVKRISHKYHCTVDINVTMTDADSIGARPIASWVDVDGIGLHLVQGDLLKLKVDAVLLLTTTLGVPVCDLLKQSLKKCFINASGTASCTKLKLGETFVKQATKDNPCIVMLAVANPSSDSMDSVVNSITQFFKDVLNGDKYKSVSIHASTTDCHAPDFLQQFMNAAYTSKLQCYICCTPDENAASIANVINQHHLLEQMFMRLRRIYAMDMQFEGFYPLEIDVRSGSLIEQRVEAIVNTVNRKLVLNKGKISALILKHGGTSIQTECNERCKGELPEGQCVVTEAGSLKTKGIKRIIHCVLPKFQKNTFQMVINRMVKLCLLEADRHTSTAIAIPLIGTGRNKYPMRDTMYAMIAAAKEYEIERVCAHLETVLFVAPESDFMQVKAVNEDTFSGDLIISKETPALIPGLYQQLSIKGENVFVHVTNISTVKRMPVSTVMFDVTDTNGVFLLRGPGLFLSQFSNTSDAIKACEGKSVTRLALRLGHDTTERCMVAIRSIIDGINTASSYEYLQHVFIILPNRIYNDTIYKLTEVTTKSQRLSSLFFAPEWLPKEDNAVVARVTVLGLANEAVDACFTHINAMIQGDLCPTKETNVDDDFVNISFEHNMNSEVSQTELYEMTALINCGIIQYLLESERLDTWLQDVKTIFGLKIIKNLSEIKVAGTFDAIIEIEKYLLNEFPRSPSTRNQGHKINTSNTRQNPSTPLSSMATLSESKGNDYYTYDFGNVNVKLTIGDILQCNENCVVSPTHKTSEKKFWLSKSLFERGGDAYRKLFAVKKEKLYPNECCVTKADALSCKRVIHVRVPKFKACNNDTQLLLEGIFLNCFETASAYGYNSIAIPAIGTGNGSDIEILELSAQQIARAIGDINRNNTLLNHIHIVLETKEYLEVFDKLIKTIDSESAPNVCKNLPPVQRRNVKVVFQHGNECNIDTLIVHDGGNISIKSFDDFMENSKSVNVKQSIGSNFASIRNVLSCDLPLWNPEIFDDILVFGRHVQQISESIFEMVIQNKWRSIGIPLFGKSVDERRFQSPVRQSSAAIVRGLKALEVKLKSQLEIYIICDNGAHLKMFNDILQRELL